MGPFIKLINVRNLRFYFWIYIGFFRINEGKIIDKIDDSSL